MSKVRWAILGPGAIARNFASGLAETSTACLMSVASRDAHRAVEFGARYGVAKPDCHGDYAAVLARDDVDAVYVGTVHTTHAQLALDAFAAGKHVVCEKPAAVNAAEVRAVIDRARVANLFFLEAYMYRFHPQIARLRELLAAKAIGEVRKVEAKFGFHVAEDRTSRLYDPELAGGAILDVGGYPMSMARLVAGAISGRLFAEPSRIRGAARKAKTGVDSEACAVVEFPDGMLAVCSVAVDREFGQMARIEGTKGEIFIDMPWSPGRDAGPSDSIIEITDANGTVSEQIKDPSMLFAFEARAACEAILNGKTQTQQMSWSDSIGNNLALDAWRDEVGYAPLPERIATSRRLKGVVPVAAPMSKLKIEGVSVPVSRLVMGCDNQKREPDGSVIWDAWLEAGGNAFDTAWLYGDGGMERKLGAWMHSRGVRDEVAVIVKGCHSPLCDPVNLRVQLEQSLDRLRTDRADMYLLHRDNLDLPVGEFVDVLDELAAAGRIGAYGGSNWTLARLRVANDWAQANGKKGFSLLSNNLSLAQMKKPLWSGCVSSHDNEVRDYLNERGIAHFSWSSQARGYFLPESDRHLLPAATGPEECFGCDANEKRRDRAEELAKEKGVSANSVALAWVLAQKFPSFALVGPRSPGEITSSLPALEVELSGQEIAWLNLEDD